MGGEVITHGGKKWRGRERVQIGSNGVERRRRWECDGTDGSCGERWRRKRRQLSGKAEGESGGKRGVNVPGEKVSANIPHYCSLQMFCKPQL